MKWAQFPLGRVERRCEQTKRWAERAGRGTRVLCRAHFLSVPLPGEYLGQCLCQSIPSASLCASKHIKCRIQASRLAAKGSLVLYKTFTSGHWLHIKYSKLLSLH